MNAMAAMLSKVNSNLATEISLFWGAVVAV